MPRTELDTLWASSECPPHSPGAGEGLHTQGNGHGGYDLSAPSLREGGLRSASSSHSSVPMPAQADAKQSLLHIPEPPQILLPLPPPGFHSNQGDFKGGNGEELRAGASRAERRSWWELGRGSGGSSRGIPVSYFLWREVPEAALWLFLLCLELLWTPGK